MSFQLLSSRSISKSLVFTRQSQPLIWLNESSGITAQSEGPTWLRTEDRMRIVYAPIMNALVFSLSYCKHDWHTTIVPMFVYLWSATRDAVRAFVWQIVAMLLPLHSHVIATILSYIRGRYVSVHWATFGLTRRRIHVFTCISCSRTRNTAPGCNPSLWRDGLSSTMVVHYIFIIIIIIITPMTSSRLRKKTPIIKSVQRVTWYYETGLNWVGVNCRIRILLCVTHEPGNKGYNSYFSTLICINYQHMVVLFGWFKKMVKLLDPLIEFII